MASSIIPKTISEWTLIATINADNITKSVSDLSNYKELLLVGFADGTNPYDSFILPNDDSIAKIFHLSIYQDTDYYFSGYFEKLSNTSVRITKTSLGWNSFSFRLYAK